ADLPHAKTPACPCPELHHPTDAVPPRGPSRALCRRRLTPAQQFPSSPAARRGANALSRRTCDSARALGSSTIQESFLLVTYTANPAIEPCCFPFWPCRRRSPPPPRNRRSDS